MEGEVRVGYQLAARLRNVKVTLPAAASDRPVYGVKGRLHDVSPFWIDRRPVTIRLRDDGSERWSMCWTDVLVAGEGQFTCFGQPTS